MGTPGALGANCGRNGGPAEVGGGKKGLVPAVGGSCLTGGPLETGGASLDG